MVGLMLLFYQVMAAESLDRKLRFLKARKFTYIK